MHLKKTNKQLEKQLFYQDAKTLINMLKTREISSIDLLETIIRHVNIYNPQINAISVMDLTYARERAKAADRAIINGNHLGKLHGLPMTIKNLPDCSKMSNDSELLFKLLEKEGAVVYGRTNSPLNAQDVQTYNQKYGTTNNPWDITRTPGGSSGGSSAALAAGFTSLEVGSDIGGSIRVPASHCGIFGHKPTFGVICQRGSRDLNDNELQRAGIGAGLGIDMSIRGPMARTAADLGLLMDVLTSHPDPLNQHWNLNLHRPTKTHLGEYRIAVWDSQVGFPVNKEINEAIETVMTLLKKKGAYLDTKARPDFEINKAHNLYLQLLGATVTTRVNWKEASKWHHHHQSSPEIDALEGRLWEADDRDLVIKHSITQTHKQWYQANQQRNMIRLKWDTFFKQGFDAVLMPIYPCPAILHNHAEKDIIYPQTIYGPFWRPTEDRCLMIDGISTPYHDAIFWSGIANLSYLPSTAFPAGKGAESGLPIGLQLIGPEGSDYCTIAIAELLEEAGLTCELPPTYAS